MDKLNRYTNLIPTTIYNINYKRNTDLEKLKFFNISNTITNFNINYIKKPKIIYEIVNKSFEYIGPKFSIQKVNDIIIKKRTNNLNITENNKNFQFLSRTTEKKDKDFYETFTYNKFNTTIQSPIIKDNSQKREENLISTIPKSKNINIKLNNKESFLSSNKSEVINNIDTNSDTYLLNTNELKTKKRDESEFFNSINKTSILKMNIKSEDDKKFHKEFRTFDERGFVYNSNATYIDNDGETFNEYGFDKNNGRYDNLGIYIPGPNYNEQFNMYNDDIKNLSFDDVALSKEIEEKEKIEFEKIKMEGKESKKLLKNYLLPIEKDDSSDDLNITEEYEKLDISDDLLANNSNNTVHTNEKSKKINNDTNNPFLNTEINNNTENKIIEDENKESQNNEKTERIIEDKDEIDFDLNNIKDEINIEKTDKKAEKNEENIIIENVNDDDIDKKETKKDENNEYKNRINELKKTFSITKENKIENKKDKKIKKVKKRKSNKKVSNIKNEDIKDNDNDNQNNKNENQLGKAEQIKFKKPYIHTPDLTEERLNKKEDNFEDIEIGITIRNVFKELGYDPPEREECIEEITNILLEKIKKHSENQE